MSLEEAQMVLEAMFLVTLREEMHMKVRPVTLHEIMLPRFVGFQ